MVSQEDTLSSCFQGVRGTLVIFMGRSGQGSGWRKCRSHRHTYFHANKYHSEGAGVLKCVVGSYSFLSGVCKNCHGAIALDGPWIVFQKCSWKRNCQETPAHPHCLEIQAAVPNHPWQPHASHLGGDAMAPVGNCKVQLSFPLGSFSWHLYWASLTAI